MKKTSLEAHKGVIERGQKITHGEMVLQALRVRKRGTYEEIAMFCNLTPMQVVRRLSELEKAGKIRNSGKRGRTFSGDTGYVWELVENPAPNVQIGLFDTAA